MPRTCTKQFTLHVEPAPASCFPNQTNVAGDLEPVAISASTPATPNAAYAWDPIAPATLKYNLTTRTFIGASGASAYPGAFSPRTIAYASANNSIYLGGIDLNFVEESAFLKISADGLAETDILNFGGATLSIPLGAVYAPDQNAIFFLREDQTSNDKWLGRIDCGTDTIGSVLLSAIVTEFMAAQVGYKTSNSRCYIPITDNATGFNTRIEERDAAGALTNTIGGAGAWPNDNLYGCVYCPSNDRLYLITQKIPPDNQFYVLCINPSTGALDATIGPLVAGAGATKGRLLSYDANRDLVYPALRPLVAIEPATNTVACTYAAMTVAFFQCAPGDNEVAVPGNPPNNLGILHV